MPQNDPEARERDVATVGFVFIGVLFAAVVTKVLELSTAVALPIVGISHLVLAALVTITSWIGYHNSASRSIHRIYFFNLPLILFVIEMIHVYLYWLLAATSETSDKPQPSAVPEALLLAAVFLSFVLWDRTALMIKRSPRYGNSSPLGEQPNRRRVTLVSFLIVLLAAAGVLAFNPTDTISVVLVDAGLCLIVIFHRAAQNLVSGAPMRNTDL